jgi:hypothetical protein
MVELYCMTRMLHKGPDWVKDFFMRTERTGNIPGHKSPIPKRL